MIVPPLAAFRRHYSAGGGGNNNPLDLAWEERLRGGGISAISPDTGNAAIIPGLRMFIPKKANVARFVHRRK
jgi:hypothetical protein